MSLGQARKQCQAQRTAEAQTQVSQFLANAFQKQGAIVPRKERLVLVQFFQQIFITQEVF